MTKRRRCKDKVSGTLSVQGCVQWNVGGTRTSSVERRQKEGSMKNQSQVMSEERIVNRTSNGTGTVQARVQYRQFMRRVVLCPVAVVVAHSCLGLK